MDNLVNNMSTIDNQLSEFKELFFEYIDTIEKFAQNIYMGKS